jgi:hypothetical protein
MTKAMASASVSRTTLVVVVLRSALCNISCAYVVLNISALERSRCGGGRFRVRLNRLLWLPG